MSNSKITILACGGTIDKIYFDAKSDYQIGEPQIQTILRESNVCVDYVVTSVVRKDSLEMTDQDRDDLCTAVEKAGSNRILITHGTDTMIETAKYLKKFTDKTIVLTGSMEPARFRNTDAHFNIGGGLIAVQTLSAGVYIVMNSKVFNPDLIRKNVGDSIFEQIP